MRSASPGNSTEKKSLADSLWPTMGKRLIAVWVSLAVAVFASVYLFTFQERLRLDLDRVAHIRETLSLVYDLENQLAEAESGARGYILTRDAQQLARYRGAVEAIDGAFDELYQQTATDREPSRILNGLKPLIKAREALFQKSIDLLDQEGIESPEYRAATRDGTSVQNRLRKGLEKLEDTEKKLLNPEWAREKRKTRIILWSLTTGTMASFTLLILVVYLLNREISSRKRAESQVTAYQENLRSLASALSLTEERERRRLSVYLHDQIGHTLALTNIRLGELQKRAPSQLPGFPGEELEKIGSLLKQAIRDTQSLTFRISSPILYELGLEAALEWLCEQVQKEHGLSVRFVADGRRNFLREDVRVLLFQAVNELLVNVVKHAQAHNLEVSVRREGGNLKVEVGDDGVGFQVPQTGARRPERGGFGLFSIRERLRPVGGRLEVQSAPGAGTHVSLAVPLADDSLPGEPHAH
jgi:signal transduction histidine kinase